MLKIVSTLGTGVVFDQAYTKDDVNELSVTLAKDPEECENTT